MKQIIFIFILLLGFDQAMAVDYTADANCRGAWLMEDDGDETDVSASGETLTETSGDIPQSATHKFGTYSRDFERTETEYLTHADGGSTDISGANQAISIVAWYMPESVGINANLVAKWDPTLSQKQYRLYVYSSTDCVRAYICSDGTTDLYAVGDTALLAVNWYHVAMVYNDTDIRVYINGVLDENGASNPKAFTDGIYAGTAPFCVGEMFDNGAPAVSLYADGLIDEVAVFNRALSAAEVLDIATNGLEGTTTSTNYVPIHMRHYYYDE